jgi:cobalamin biosynthesis Mg chelatase CobN
MSCLQNRLSTRVRVEACLLSILAIASAPLGASAQAATGAAANNTTPTFPTPASARVHTGAAGARTPTTTYVPAPSLAGAAAKGTTTAAQPTTTLKSTSIAPARTRARAKPSSKLSTAAIVVAAIAALLALGCAAWGLARRRAFEPHWLLSLRHAMAEAGFRTSATWAEFADWARLGR